MGRTHTIYLLEKKLGLVMQEQQGSGGGRTQIACNLVGNLQFFLAFLLITTLFNIVMTVQNEL